MFVLSLSRLPGLVSALGFALFLALAAPLGVGAATVQISTDPFTQATCAPPTPPIIRPRSSPTRSLTARRSSPRTRSGASSTAARAPSASPRPRTTARAGRAGCCRASPSGPGRWPERPRDRRVRRLRRQAQRLADLVAHAARGGRRARQRRGDQPLDRRRPDLEQPVHDGHRGDLDKNWIVCDNTASSPFYGNCYTEWDNHGAGNLLQMSTSTDGGLTWSAPATNNTGVIGGQPVVRPDGTVIVPIDNANETAIGAFNSTNGGATWSAVTTIATIRHHTVAGSLREGPLPSAEIDGAGTVYVAWADCRFRRACKSQRHRHQPFAQRHRDELVGGESRADRRRPTAASITSSRGWP